MENVQTILIFLFLMIPYCFFADFLGKPLISPKKDILSEVSSKIVFTLYWKCQHSIFENSQWVKGGVERFW